MPARSPAWSAKTCARRCDWLPQARAAADHQMRRGAAGALDDLAPQPQDTAQAGRAVRALRIQDLAARTAMVPRRCRRRSRQRQSARRQPTPPPRCNTRAHYETMLTEAATRRLAGNASRRAADAVDTETTGLDPLKARLVGMSLAVEPGHAAYMPLGHDYPGAPDQLGVEQVLAQAQALAGKRAARQARPEPQVRQARLRQPRHRACAASRTTRCCNPTCWKATSGTTWTSWRMRHLGDEDHHLRRGAGKGAKQIGFDQVVDRDAPPSTPPRTPTSRCNCIRRCTRRSQPTQSSRTSTATSKCR